LQLAMWLSMFLTMYFSRVGYALLRIKID
jgi:hypothetical protein